LLALIDRIIVGIDDFQVHRFPARHFCCRHRLLHLVIVVIRRE
jgi:hypothetical protein